MSIATRFVLKLTLRIEIYTNLIVVPLAVYFAVISGGLTEQKVFYFIISTLIAAGIMMIIGITFRSVRLSKILNRLDDKDTDFYDLKIKLLEDPRAEGILMCCRWIFGVAICYIIFRSLVQLTFLESFPILLINLFTLPVNSVIAYFTTENLLSEFLVNPKISSVYLPHGSYKLFSVFSRTIFIVIPVLLIPVVTLGYFFYLSSLQLIQFTNFPYHITLIVALSIAAIYTAVYESTRGIRSGLDKTIINLESLEKGELEIDPIPMLTKGEVGGISQYVNYLANSLRKSEEMFSKAFISSPVGIAVISLFNGQILDINESLLAISGYTREELIEKAYFEIGLFQSDDEVNNLIDILLNENQLRNYDIHILTKSGESRICTISAEIIQIRFETCMIATIEDITEKKQLENEIMRISETERQKVGQDLHDDLGPHLIGIEVLSKLLQKKMGEKSLPEEDIVEKIRNLINDAITKTRNLARGLCPVYLMDHGLEYSLKEMSQNVKDVFGISCRLKHEDIQLPGDIGICTHLYYIIQETVHNAVKHGNADNILIEIYKDDDKIIITIEDDGTGLVHSNKPAGMGLRIMEYRAKIIGAAIDMKSTKGKGTKMKISLHNNLKIPEVENRYVKG